MRLPSLDQVTLAALRTLRRFPFAIVNAIIGSAAAVAIIDWSGDRTDLWPILNNIFVASTLGIALFTTAVIVGERFRWPALRILLGQSFAAVLLVLYWETLPSDIYAPPFLYGIRHWLLIFGVHMLAAVAPFVRKGEINGFWQYNKSLFLRFLTAALFSGVLWAGLSIALAAVDNLFAMHIRGERYAELWVLIAGIFNTWFFLSGVPENLDELDKDASYPRGLKIFTQYVLLPLVVVYVLILYAYITKIIVEWDWPKGWVANLILGFSVTGLFSLLLVYPIRERMENVWMKRFARAYYMAEIPLVVVLMLAAWRRVEEYGITENRFLVVVLGFWLAGLVLYFLASKSASIKVIPSSLCALAFLFSFGPWGAFQVSEHSQIRRLEALLGDAGVLQQGKAARTSKAVKFEQAREISSIVRYVYQVHGLSVIQPWFDVRLDTLASAGAKEYRAASGEAKPKALVDLMGIDYVQEWQGKTEMSVHRFLARKDRLFEIKGYDHLFRNVALGESEPTTKSLPLPGGAVRLALSNSLLSISLSSAGGREDSAALSLSPLAQRLLKEYTNPYEIPGEAMALDASGRLFRVRVYFNKLVVQTGGDSVSLRRVEGDILVGGW
jgi:Domain of unknown function (DUF4153)